MPSRWRNTGWLLTHLFRRTIVYRKRTIVAVDVVELEKSGLQACNYLALASVGTNFSSRACINLKWKSCIPLAWYVSIADADGLALHRQGITSHKADPQLTTYLPAISIRICNYSSVSETSKNTNNHSWFTQPINPLILGSSCISHSNTNDLAYPYQTPRKIGWNLRTLTWLWRNWPLCNWYPYTFNVNSLPHFSDSTLCVPQSSE